MNDAFDGLEPRDLWEHFSNLTQIPRPSKQEGRAVAYVESVARRLGVVPRRDDAGNVLVPVPATPGREKAPTLVLQGHLDMVGEKNDDVTHDFSTDPIRARREGEWITASGTTLGADNGIGVAAALAAATDGSVRHGPLELLFTIDEETGLTGAAGLDPALVSGRTLLNLDSEEDGVIFVGCSGGCDTLIDVDDARSAPWPGTTALRLEIRGLRGGHSGLNIHENRGNALKLAARILEAAAGDGIEFELASIRGGSKHNAIPREARAHLHVAADRETAFRERVDRMAAGFAIELAGADDGLSVTVSPAPAASSVWPREASRRFADLLMVLPHGVLAMSRDIPGLVETSSNLAAVSEEGGALRIVTSSRSSVAPSLAHVLAGIRSAARLARARTRTRDGYPGWRPDLGSPALQTVREVYRRRWGVEPRVTAIHAGLECGLLGEKIPGLDMVSFGPQIEGAHSPDERVQIPSVERFWGALVDVLDRFSA